VVSSHTNFYQSNNNPIDLNCPHFEEQEALNEFVKQNNKTAIFDFCLIKMMLGVYFDQYEAVFKFRKMAKENISARTGSVVTMFFYFFDSLLLLNSNGGQIGKSGNQIMRTVVHNQKILLKRAKINPGNFMNKYYLVEAEKNRFKKNYALAESFYEKSLNYAATSGFIQEEALAKEYYAKLYIEKNAKRIAEILLQECLDLYDKWKAFNKKKQLLDLYPDLIKENVLYAKGHSENVLSFKNKVF